MASALSARTAVASRVAAAKPLARRAACVTPRCQAVAPKVQAARQARRAMLASVVALPLLAARSARAEEEAAADVDIRALILSTILMGVAGFTAVGAASTPKSADHHDHH